MPLRLSVLRPWHRAFFSSAKGAPTTQGHGPFFSVTARRWLLPEAELLVNSRSRPCLVARSVGRSSRSIRSYQGTVASRVGIKIRGLGQHGEESLSCRAVLDGKVFAGWVMTQASLVAGRTLGISTDLNRLSLFFRYVTHWMRIFCEVAVQVVRSETPMMQPHRESCCWKSAVSRNL